MNIDVLNTPIEFLKGVGPKRADLLKSEMSIYTFRDLLSHFPFRYVDRAGELPREVATILKGFMNHRMGPNRIEQPIALIMEKPIVHARRHIMWTFVRCPQI